MPHRWLNLSHAARIRTTSAADPHRQAVGDRGYRAYAAGYCCDPIYISRRFDHLGGGAPVGVHVFAADGKYLGHIPAPRSLITAAFAGPDKKTLYGIANDRVRVDIYAIPMIAQGVKGRAK